MTNGGWQTTPTFPGCQNVGGSLRALVPMGAAVVGEVSRTLRRKRAVPDLPLVGGDRDVPPSPLTTGFASLGAPSPKPLR